MRAYLKDAKDREDAALQLKKAIQETLRILDEIDPSKRLLSKMPLPPKGKIQ
jgi:hypothetical protein